MWAEPGPAPLMTQRPRGGVGWIKAQPSGGAEACPEDPEEAEDWPGPLGPCSKETTIYTLPQGSDYHDPENQKPAWIQVAAEGQLGSGQGEADDCQAGLRTF